ncbi:iron chelate uptake ABC transporter family permease subunit [Phaeovulum sp. NW3]|uniref:iron chelate uptake ABC transporter family permease subunit n=1 Tax=Phaeovulum sp. NW3 TaxID=2934933 RepID=UPI0020219FF8|nr:iron chelate uptake ABC transporter family permease subunit [Phaeovulum sp. NW3]MCL7464927.1 metal ABC transporter permease [Phaeovulum sp. NW3]
MLDDFLTRAALAGLGLTLATGPLGALVVWRRMAYFGDATAHAAILGVAISFGFGLSVYAGTLAVALGMAITVATLAGRGHAMDTTLGVLAHSALALGLVAASFQSGLRVDLSAWLFGDILAVSRADLAVVAGGAVAVLALLVWRWQGLLTATVNEELAQAAGLNPRHERLALTLALALVVAVSIKIVGALLISALLIIPAAAARGVARTPEQMAVAATLAGAVSVLAGLGASMRFGTPAGPSIVTAAAALFLLSLPLRGRVGG